ncbi:BTAD domain-containing putative transcriptional regulator [uncultured Mucilaginibacter sp.]|uniref:Kelch repeat-containing protein n=1 Tax=uncultured Mucilaginibacter sp. TaxID=797541 RepID=UPI0025D1A913|nr:BTAD domain-containing putative transcriptional regulator [uncultured Mucilaginibacter sp.]
MIAGCGKYWRSVTYTYFLITLFSCSLVSAQGLLFNSNNASISKRTSYQVFGKNEINIRSHLHVDFELMLWDQNHLGYIFQFGNSENSISLSHLNTHDTSSLNLNIDRVSNKIKAPFDLNKLGRKWVKIAIDLDVAHNTVELNIGGQKFKASGLPFNNSATGNITFGKNASYTEVPDMAIRNVNVVYDDDTEHFPLHEWSGNSVSNANGKTIGNVDNPIWLINDSYFWKPLFSKKFGEVAGINYRKQPQQLLIYGRDSLYTYSPSSNKLDGQRYANKNPVAMILGKSIYSEKQQLLYVYEPYDIRDNGFSIAALNLQNLTWKGSGKGQLPTQRHHHNVFFNAAQDTLFMFGGYGSFKYHNSFYKFDQSANDWVTVKFNGDDIHPRFFSASGPAENQDEVYVFGGFGNQSGSQVVGGKEYYDLYRVNTKKHWVKKCWSIKLDGKKFVPANNLLLSPDKKSFYVLCYPHEVAKTHLKLYKFTIEDGSFEEVGSSIPVTSEKIETDINLFYNSDSQQFYCSIQEFTDPQHSSFRVLALDAPPISQEAYLKRFEKPSSASILWISAGIGCLIVALGGALLYFKRGKSSQPAPVNNELNSETVLGDEQQDESVISVKQDQEETVKNAVYLLGEFSVADSSGRDITHLFSPKIKQLFLLILLNSKDSKGITSRKLTGILWPDKDAIKAKNLRGVTFNHLRNILSGIEGIDLQFVNDSYLFTTNQSFFCDYYLASDLLDNSSATDTGKQHQLNQLLLRGPILEGMSEHWLDDYKQSFDEKAVNALQLQLNELAELKKWKEANEIAKLILSIDPFNDSAFSSRLKALKATKGTEYARQFYKSFRANYYDAFGEDYQHDFETASK